MTLEKPARRPLFEWIARLFGGALSAMSWAAAGPAFAVSLGDMAREAADDLEAVPTLLAITFYIIGAALSGSGFSS